MSFDTNGNGNGTPRKVNFFTQDPKAAVPKSTEDLSVEMKEQMREVKVILEAQKLMNQDRLNFEVEWFFGALGIHRYYFQFNNSQEIAEHIASLYAAKTISQINGNDLDLRLSNTLHKGKALFICRSSPGNAVSPCQDVEHVIEANYLGEGFHHASKYSVDPPSISKHYNVQCYRTSGTISPESSVHLRIYLVNEPQYSIAECKPNETDLALVSDVNFYNSLSPPRRDFYAQLMKEAATKMNPLIRIFDTEGKEKHLVIGHRSGTTHSYFSGVTDLYHSFGLYCSRKHVRQFLNGITIFSIYLLPRDPNVEITPDMKSGIIEATNLVYILPRTSIQNLLREGALSVKEYTYAYVVWKFAFHFLARQSSQFAELAAALKHDEAGAKLLDQIKKAVRKEAYTEGRVMEVIVQYPQFIKEFYKEFEMRHLSNPNTPHDYNEMLVKVQKQVQGEFDREVLGALSTFNRSLLKTNFFKPTKIALSFRLSPEFLSQQEFPVRPFGLFFLVGPEFRGFHIRFRDIARGGIRSIRSNNWQAYVQNVTTVLDENYNLALTQERKNKDIAEGGSKGTILLSLDHPDKSFTAFQKYVDCLLDLLLPDPTIVDYYQQEEILFLGPDEGTANFMDWASQHARDKGYKYWKAFTTGKGLEYGGIPHDLFGMTTRSVHQYVLGVLGKLQLDESQCTKIQTGGPDGDLGSNEIKISKDKTTAVVDGSGVLVDPQGINREALTALAKARKMVKEFPVDKLSKDGFFVDVEAVDLKTPSGTIIQNGLDFRNTFHLSEMSAGDLFVPCGGRPESVNMSNVHQLLDPETKKPKFKVIVEGANLFFTNDSRLYLEKKGVIIYKDASANKGGVTSSSLEVLAALALSDAEFAKHMAVQDLASPPEFYSKYVVEVQKRIEENARLEFECIWNEHEKSHIPRSTLSDLISNKINQLSLSISASDLWLNDTLRRRVLTASVPRTLSDLVGMDAIIERIPDNYARALFGCYLASRYVYTCGLSDTPEFTFFSFLQGYLQAQ